MKGPIKFIFHKNPIPQTPRNIWSLTNIKFLHIRAMLLQTRRLINIITEKNIKLNLQ